MKQMKENENRLFKTLVNGDEGKKKRFSRKRRRSGGKNGKNRRMSERLEKNIG